MPKHIDWRQVMLGAALTLSALWLCSLIWNLGSKAELAWREAHDTRTQFEQLEARRQVLEGDLAALQTPRGQDAAIREAFGVAKPGEEVIIVVPPGTTTATSSPAWWNVFDWF